MNDIADSLEAAAYAAKAGGAEAAVSKDNTFSRKLKKISKIDIFESSDEIMSSCGSVLGEKRSLAVVSGLKPESVSAASSMRVPAVIVNIPKTSGFTSMVSDSSDVIFAKDAGALIFLPENCQEVLDNTVQAYRICEDNKVLLPAVIIADNHEAREVVQIPSDNAVENMLPKLKLPSRLDVKKPVSFNLPVDDHSEFRMQQSKAMENASDVMKKTFEKWDEKFRRKYSMLETHKMEGAEYVFVVAGSDSSVVRSAVNSLDKAGMIRVRVLRPFPKEILDMIKGKKVAVIDSSGVLSEIPSDIVLVTSGKRLSEKNVSDVYAKLKKAESGRIWL